MARICSAEGCDQPVHARGYCSQHYRQWHKANETRRCSVQGCDGRLSARGYCHKHYVQWLKYGDVNIARKGMPALPLPLPIPLPVQAQGRTVALVPGPYARITATA